MYEFGQSIRDKEFLLDKNNALINHGSWGTVPKKIFDLRVKLMKEVEHNPDHWFRRTVESRYVENLKAVADFLGAKYQDIVFVVNATEGINCVLKSLPMQKGDAILIQSYTYNAIRNTALSAAKAGDGEVLTVSIPLHIDDPSHIVDNYNQMLQQHPNIKIVVLDYISSCTGILFPIKDIIKVVKEHGALVMLDGAHTPGQLPVNLSELGSLGVDFYVGNFHKWVFTPRGCAVLYIHPSHQDIIRPVVTSHCYNDVIQKDFFTQGTKDDTPFLCVKAAIGFYQDIGGYDKIVTYSTGLMDKAIDMLVKAWSTQKQPIPKDMEAPFLRLVELPPIPKYPVPNAVFDDMKPLMTELYERFQVSTTVLVVRGKVWVRLSAFVYNTMQDYEKLRDAILVIHKEIK